MDVKLNLDPDPLTRHSRAEYDKFKLERKRDKFLKDTKAKWRGYKLISNENKEIIDKLLNEIWELNKEKGIQDVVIKWDKNKKEAMQGGEIITSLKESIEEWKQLYGREITSGSYAAEPMPWIYTKTLIRFFINPTNAAVIVMFFTLYSTYYWLDRQSISVSEATNMVSTLISGIMTFMLTVTLASGKDKEKEVIKKFEALSGDIKAMAMYLVHATYDHEKYLMQEDGSLKYDNRVRDQFHKMQYLLAILSPTARKVLQGKRSFLFPEYLGDSNSFMRDLVNLRIDKNDKRYFYLSAWGALLTLWTLGFIALVISTVVVYIVDEISIMLILLLVGCGVGLTYFIYVVRWTEFRLCGWGCCCKSTPYADVDDLELIPFTSKRKESILNNLYVFCCLSTKYKRKYRRWSEKQCDQNNEPENCTNGLEYALYKKIKETQSRTGMDLFETEMTILLDEITKIGELNIGLGKDEGSAVLRAVLNKWELIYASWGEMSSVKSYSEPILIQLYRAFFIFMYAFITPIKYLPLHENDNNWCVFNCKGYSLDPYIWWTVVDVSVYAVLWWVAYYIRNPFDKELWFGRSELIVSISTTTQKQVNRFVMNAKHLEENDYQQGFRYGWGGKGNNPYPIGYTNLRFADENTAKWGERDIDLAKENIRNVAELNNVAGNMFNWRKVINTMKTNGQIYGKEKFKQALKATAYSKVYSTAILDTYVKLYMKNLKEEGVDLEKERFVSADLDIFGIDFGESPKGGYKIVSVI